MLQLFKKIDKKVNEAVYSLIGTGLLLFILGFLIAGTEYTLRILVGTGVLIIAFSCFYGAYKLWVIKKELKDHFKL